MSYSDYQYPSAASAYESYSQPYDAQPYSSGSQPEQFVQYDYTTSSQSLDQYAQPAASPSTDYTGYNTSNAGYTSTVATGYLDSSSSSYTSYQYSQDSTKSDHFTSHSSGPSDSASGSFSTPASHYTTGTATPDQAISQPVSDYNSYSYQPTDYSQLSSSYGQDNTSSGYSGTYDPNSSGYSCQAEPSQPSDTWTSSDQYTSYNADYYEESTTATGYHQKEASGSENMDNSPSVDRYSQVTGGGGSSYAQPVRYSVTDDRSSGYQDRYSVPDDHSIGYQGYVTPSISQLPKPQQEFGGYSGPARFNRGSDNNNRGSERGGSFGVASSSSVNYYSGGRGRGRGDFQSKVRDNFVGRGRNSDRFSGGQENAFPTQTSTAWRSFNSQSGGGSSLSSRGFSNRGSRGRGFSTRGSFLSVNRGDQHSTIGKSSLEVFDARNKSNDARSAGTAPSKVTKYFQSFSKNRVPVSSFKPPEPIRKEVFKAPARPQDRLLNEIEEREKAQRAEELKKSEEEKKKAEEKRLKALEEEKKWAEEQLRKKVAEEAVKAAPPSKPPETAEEIAHEEEIQRKIRESLVIINPEQEIALLKEDPTQEIEMPEELRKLLKNLTTYHFCKLCSVRMAGPQMATMHYNGKNHIKKLRNFVQTNGRSAGFNMESLEKAEKDEQKEGSAGENKAEIVELTDIDEKRYCKICKVSFTQESQAEMHYRGKNHAKKMKSIGTGNGPEVYECKICCVTVTAQEILTAHLNGARHKLQVRKIDAGENYRGGPRGRGRGIGFRGRGRGGSRGDGNSPDGDWRPLPAVGVRGRGFRGRGHDDFMRGQGFKRRGGFDDGPLYRGDFGPPFPKRPRF